MAARRRDYNRLLKEYPMCAYCGGTSSADTVDHCPPISMFVKRDRPKGLETPSCNACNQGAKECENLVAFLGQMKFGQIGEAGVQHFSELCRHMMNNHPALVDALRPTIGQKRYIERLSNAVGDDFGVLDLRQPIVSRNILLFGAKLAMSLHFHQRKEVLPPNGRIAVMFFSNQNVLEETVPHHLFDMLPDTKTLRQGQKEVGGQFLYSSGATTDSDATAHWASFGDALCFFMFAGTRINSGSLPSDHIFRPGCLK